jgi:uncharacterized protein (TIGR00251 family)
VTKTPVKPTKDGIVISLYVQPGASKTAWAGLMGDALKLRVSARPIEGEANKEVQRFLAESFSVAKSAVTITHGLQNRNKTVHVAGDAMRLLSLAEGFLTG